MGVYTIQGVKGNVSRRAYEDYKKGNITKEQLQKRYGREGKDEDKEKKPIVATVKKKGKTFTEKFLEHPIGKVLSSTKTTFVLGSILVGLTGYGVAAGTLGTKGGFLGSAAWSVQITPASAIGKVLVGAGALVKAGGFVFAGLAAISGTSGIMTWLASDNIAQAMAIFTRDLREAVTWGHITAADAQEEMNKAQGWIDEAESFIEINTLLNPALWPLREIIKTNIKGVQNAVDFNRKIISSISPVIKTEDEDWNKIQETNRERELSEQAEDEAYFDRIREEAVEDKAEQRLIEEAYWAKVSADNILRKTGDKLGEGVYWDSIRAGATTVDAIIAGEKAKADFLATGQLPTTPEGQTEGQPKKPQDTEESALNFGLLK